MINASELPITTVREGTTALDMAQTIFGDGVTVTGASYTGDIDSAGVYYNGFLSPSPGNSGVILSTGNAEDFTNSTGLANQSANTSTNTSGPNNQAAFNAIAGTGTRDASYLDVDFVPTGNVMAMEFVFASDEYPEYVNSVYQDFMVVWVNGTEVPIAVGDARVNPANINADKNENLFVDNAGSVVNSEMDGLTITLSLTIPVNDGVVNSIRFGIADVADSLFDSSLLIAGDSVQTALVALEDFTTLKPSETKTIDVLGNDIASFPEGLEIKQINGIEVGEGETIVLKSGQSVTVNGDGTLTITGDGDPEDFNFTYLVEDGQSSDTGIVNVGTIPCFVAGTRIETLQGLRAVETLKPGELIATHDDGPQPLRWIGRRTIRAEGAFAPVHIQANTFGSHDTLIVSPEHRILVRDPVAEMLFGETEVLVAAKYLVNGRSVRRRVGGFVTYVHLMFDAHQVIYSEGLATESFLPGPQTTEVFERDILREICSIFPELDPNTGQGYSTSARRTLRQFEADLWRAQTDAA